VKERTETAASLRPPPERRKTGLWNGIHGRRYSQV